LRRKENECLKPEPSAGQPTRSEIKSAQRNRKGVNTVVPHVLVVDVVRMLPHVHGEDGLLAVGDGVSGTAGLVNYLPPGKNPLNIKSRRVRQRWHCSNSWFSMLRVDHGVSMVRLGRE